jgi:hypothetical protein
LPKEHNLINIPKTKIARITPNIFDAKKR